MRHLNIVGEQGSGKSLLARWIANRSGKFVELDSSEITSTFTLGNALASEPKVIIIDWHFVEKDSLSVLKMLMSNESIECNRKGRQVVFVPAPTVILCSIEPILEVSDVLLTRLTN